MLCRTLSTRRDGAEGVWHLLARATIPTMARALLAGEEMPDTGTGRRIGRGPTPMKKASAADAIEALLATEERKTQPMCNPPLTANSAPVVKPEVSQASQLTMEAISSGVPRRLTGIVATIFSSTSGLIALTMSVPM